MQRSHAMNGVRGLHELARIVPTAPRESKWTLNQLAQHLTCFDHTGWMDLFHKYLLPWAEARPQQLRMLERLLNDLLKISDGNGSFEAGSLLLLDFSVFLEPAAAEATKAFCTKVP